MSLDAALKLGLTVVAIIAVAGWVSRARWVGIADAHEEAADSLTVVVDRVSRANVTLADSITLLDSVYTADSIRWQQENAENRAQIAALTSRASSVADSLRSRLDSAGTALLARYEAATDSIIAAKGWEISNLKAERASLWAQRETMGELIQGLRDENTGLRAVNASLTQANEALRRAAAPRLFDFDMGRDPWLVGLGVLGGYLLAEAWD